MNKNSTQKDLLDIPEDKFFPIELPHNLVTDLDKYQLIIKNVITVIEIFKRTHDKKCIVLICVNREKIEKFIHEHINVCGVVKKILYLVGEWIRQNFVLKLAVRNGIVLWIIEVRFLIKTEQNKVY